MLAEKCKIAADDPTVAGTCILASSTEAGSCRYTRRETRRDQWEFSRNYCVSAAAAECDEHSSRCRSYGWPLQLQGDRTPTRPARVSQYVRVDHHEACKAGKGSKKGDNCGQGELYSCSRAQQRSCWSEQRPRSSHKYPIDYGRKYWQENNAK